MIAANVHSFLQQLSLVDNYLQLQLLDWQEGEMELFQIYTLINPKLETEDYNRLTYQYSRTMCPSMTKIVAMTVHLWPHQGFWGINKAREKLREYKSQHKVLCGPIGMTILQKVPVCFPSEMTSYFHHRDDTEAELRRIYDWDDNSALEVIDANKDYLTEELDESKKNVRLYTNIFQIVGCITTVDQLKKIFSIFGHQLHLRRVIPQSTKLILPYEFKWWT
jgi:hypothetical protein